MHISTVEASSKIKARYAAEMGIPTSDFSRFLQALQGLIIQSIEYDNTQPYQPQRIPQAINTSPSLLTMGHTIKRRP
ncbi:unnamed protein product [Bursaphelenchus xylophilus]|uniref:(pine wood nematode) hypothetical protein n=1 Tax=Bursaphelenchus xylophilus TaxID=6326 RepID=A0A1I7S837_BURXY|nr:unnamed protein product [Bursaphelenchus xylophilus]CAG9080619.1 unnamed protein product [Bursaphelenchus xylophilus]